MRASILISLLISAGGMLWACFARIPIYVNGFALLVRTGNNLELPSQTEGEVNHNFTTKNSDTSVTDQKIYKFSRQDLKLNPAQTEELIDTVMAIRDRETMQQKDFGTSKVREGSLLAWVNDPSAFTLLKQSLDTYRIKKTKLEAKQQEISRSNQNLSKKIKLLKKQTQLQYKFFQTVKELNIEGIASRALLLEEEAKVDALLKQILTEQEKLDANKDALILNKIDHHQAAIKLQTAIRTHIDKTLIFAEHDLFVTDILAPNLTQVSHKDSIFRISKQKILVPTENIPGFLSQRSAQQVRAGMKVLATPTGMSRAQHGGMLGVVTGVKMLPSSNSDLTKILGSEAIASDLTGLIPEPIQVTIQLEQDPASQGTSKQGIKWSSSGEIPYPVKRGDLLRLQITTQKVTPISLLLPWARKLSGSTPPSPVLSETSSPTR